MPPKTAPPRVPSLSADSCHSVESSGKMRAITNISIPSVAQPMPAMPSSRHWYRPKPCVSMHRCTSLSYTSSLLLDPAAATIVPRTPSGKLGAKAEGQKTREDPYLGDM